MISTYPTYKRSDIEWMEYIPSHWDELKGQFLLRKKDCNVGDAWISTQLLSLTQRGVIKKDINSGKGKTHSDYSTYQFVENGDLIFCLFDIDETPRTVGLSSFEGMITSAYSVFEAINGNDKKYLYYFFEFVDNCKGLKPYYSGMRKTVRPTEFLKILLPKPPKTEQKAIATFLDRETQRIDSLIEEKQTFIKLLKEKRQALISHVVTKGLNPNVEMQDSGIEWIGQVPKHWEKCRVKQASSFITSGPRGWSDFISDNGNAIFLQSGDLNNELGLNLAKAKKVSPPDGAEGQRTQLQLDDVVVCITGANTGRVALVKELDSTVYINQHLSLIRPIGEKVRSKYLAYFLSSEAGSCYYALEQYGLKEGLSLKNVAETPLMLPPVSEQTSIEKYLDKALATLSSLVTSVEESIHLLKERRTSLISAAVTGKIDVREAV
ncbi:restriction endonuclease subunit S [Vibrio cholerae]|uniref:restriction endonuclease subunit S n=1 Tax=Vibrio cholerae TaxID=666 RepID=UPI003967552C|nr:restriction endonuclease subunit S [Vibrio cholerae]